MNNKKKISVTVCIPAYNEEANIKHLLLSLLSQREKDFKLLEIIVVSDGSTDNTVNEVRSVGDNRVNLIVKSKRKGQAVRQNEIARSFKGDILVLLEADTLPADRDFISNLILPFSGKSASKIGFTYGRALVLQPRNFFEKVMYFKDDLKEKMFQSIENVNNLYQYNGHRGRAFSKEFAKKMRWPKDVPEDAYLFLMCDQMDFEMVHTPHALIYHKLVGNFRDYCRQYAKYVKGREALTKYFPKKNITSDYKLPFFHTLKEFIVALAKNPLLMTVYLFVLVGAKLTAFRAGKFNPFTEVYSSSKTLVLPGENKFLLEDKGTRGVLNQFDELASDYDRFAFKKSIGLQFLSNLETSFIEEHTKNDKSTLYYLDMGVGTGRNSEILLDKGIDVTGMDISENMLRETKQKLGHYVEKGQLRLQRIDLNKKLPFSEGEFDGALCIRVIKYLANWKDLISEAGRVIKKDGVFILEISDRYFVQGILRPLGNYRTFQVAEVEETFSKEGFELLDKRVGGKLPLALYRLIDSKATLGLANKTEILLRKILGQSFSRSITYYCRKT